MPLKVVVDANILFAALIKEGDTARLLVDDAFTFYAPGFLFIEFKKYKDYILERTNRKSTDFTRFMEILKRRIQLVPKKEIQPFINKAERISPDPKDVVYLALALKLNTGIWTLDKKLGEKQNTVKVYSTKDLLVRINKVEEEEN
ncbi:MAG: PIN domain-containing protein [Candidatus Hodarchaeota archaeon]